jgi:hypothetical protein
VLAPDRTGKNRYLFSKFSSEAAMATHTVKLVEKVTNTTRALVSFARNLKTASLL